MSKNPTPGKIIVIVAPSGAGKTTIAQRLLREYPKIQFSVSATTREPRKDEKDGEDYYFLSEEEFDQKIKNEKFLEWEHYSGNRYGTLRSEVDKLVESGYFPLLDIEVKGALNVQRLYNSGAISIFIKPPSLEELKNRLSKRGSETENSLQQRLKRAEMEIKYADRFDYSVVNDDLEEAYTEVKNIIEPFITD
ncbi:guanylate kinase [Fodinibius sp. AD559]|uniref:guanylate kinase n=1 Tax=Fodinibius sp. AD559 TaxID=3424179 RepID=UPI004046F856